MEQEKNMTSEKELEILRNTYLMYEKSKKEIMDVRKNKVDKDGNKLYSDTSTNETMQLMETMQADIIEKYQQLGGDVEELKHLKMRKNNRNKEILESIVKRQNARDDILAQIAAMNGMENDEKNNNNFIPEEETMGYRAFETKIKDIHETTENVSEPAPSLIDINKSNNIGNKVSFDNIPLPSKGECYKHKLSAIPVGYLTAYDENLIASPNLYNDGTFIDVILKTKIMNNIDPGTLLPGDRDAIVLWLRATGYGPEYPITATDNETGEQFDSMVDLSSLKYKPFTLKGDENGYFDFKLPHSGDVIKFKFLTYNETQKLKKLNDEDDIRIKKNTITRIKDELKFYVDEDTEIDRSMKNKLNDAINHIEEYITKITEEDTMQYSHMITNKLAASIVAVNGITDRKYINSYVMYMNVKDSFALRKYITKNEPGIDFNITVERPASLGGGSLTMFLPIDQFLFFNYDD